MELRIDIDEQLLDTTIAALKSAQVRNEQTSRLHHIETFPGIERAVSLTESIKSAMPAIMQIESSGGSSDDTMDGGYTG